MENFFLPNRLADTNYPIINLIAGPTTDIFFFKVFVKFVGVGNQTLVRGLLIVSVSHIVAENVL